LRKQKKPEKPCLGFFFLRGFIQKLGVFNTLFGIPPLGAVPSPQEALFNEELRARELTNPSIPFASGLPLEGEGTIY
jgi:hypothetical protein